MPETTLFCYKYTKKYKTPAAKNIVVCLNLNCVPTLYQAMSTSGSSTARNSQVTGLKNGAAAMLDSEIL